MNPQDVVREQNMQADAASFARRRLATVLLTMTSRTRTPSNASTGCYHVAEQGDLTEDQKTERRAAMDRVHEVNEQIEALLLIEPDRSQTVKTHDNEGRRPVVKLSLPAR